MDAENDIKDNIKENIQENINIQWYPGHMAKTKRLLAENIKLVDVVVEILDSRIPFSSRNPDLDALCAGKQRIAVLNKADLADPSFTKRWLAWFNERGISALSAESVRGKGIKEVVALAKTLMKEKIEAKIKRGMKSVVIRAMIVGVPNSGKSTFINKFVGREVARSADKPGVTRGKQWVRIVKDFELLDTPGILWPKFDDRTVGLHLAFTGAVADGIMDLTLLAFELLRELRHSYPNCLAERYGVSPIDGESEHELLGRIAIARGFLLKKGEPDLLRCATVLIDEFRAGKLGRITLEQPQNNID